MTKYTIKCEIEFKREKKKFEKQLEAHSKKQALDMVNALIGSTYKAKRGKVKIISIEEAK